MTDRIVSHPSTQAYRDNYDRVFGKSNVVEPDRIMSDAESAYYIDRLRNGEPIDVSPTESGGYAFLRGGLITTINIDSRADPEMVRKCVDDALRHSPTPTQ